MKNNDNLEELNIPALSIEQRCIEVSKAYDLFNDILDPELRSTFTKVGRDPSPLFKPNRRLDIVHIRLLPESQHRLPRNFWSVGNCYYQIYHGYGWDQMELGAVLFYQSIYHKACGNGFYFDAVEQILNEVKLKRPKDLVFVTPRDGENEFFVLKRPFKALNYRSFPRDEVAKDLIWLINETFPKFRKLTSL